MTQQPTKLGVHSEAGKLRKVMVCSPGLAHQRLTPSNCDELLFDDVLWVNQAKRDHFDFVTKMRERGVEVLEMHNLLTETVSNPVALKWILDRKITANQVGIGLQDEVRSWLEEQQPRQLAEFLIGGCPAATFRAPAAAKSSACSATIWATELHPAAAAQHPVHPRYQLLDLRRCIAQPDALDRAPPGNPCSRPRSTASIRSSPARTSRSGTATPSSTTVWPRSKAAT